MNTIVYDKQCASKTAMRFLAVLLAGTMLFGLCACVQSDPVVQQQPEVLLAVEREPESQALQIASAATAVALNQYIYARLKTEELLSVDNESLTVEEFQKLMDELVLAWKTADMLTSGALELADQAGMVMESPVFKETAAFVQPTTQAAGTTTASSMEFVKPTIQLIKLGANSSDYAATAIGASSGREIDPETWAENLTKQLDEIAYSGVPQFERIKTLAKQLGVDAKTAYEQVTLAQKIVHNIADLEELRAEDGAYTRSIEILQGYKTTSKVGLLVTATIATGGGSLATLGASSMTLGQAGAVVVGGVDCIVDVAATSSTIIMGEDHQVTTSINNIQNMLAPVSFVVGLATFNGSETGEQLAFIGESLTEWFYNGKILGINVSGTDDGGTKVTAQPINVSGLDEAGVKSELKKEGFVTPEEGNSTLSSLIEEYRTNIEDAASKMATLATEMGAIMEEYNILVQQPEETATSPTKTTAKVAIYEIRNISGTSWVIDSSSDPEYFDGLDAIYVSDYTVAPGDSIRGGINVEARLQSGALIELSPTTYSTTVTCAAGEVPSDEDEQYVYLNPLYGQTAQIYTVTITGVYGEYAVIEWDGASFTQVK
jgi:hypothetical protein